MKGDTKTRLDDLVFFNRQLASIVRTQFPLPEGLRTISKEMKDENFRRAIEEMERDVSFGIPLSQAVAKQTDVFPSLYANMLKAGEDSGNMAAILDELCEYSQTLYQLERSVKVALYYPKIVGSLILLFFMLVYNPLYYHVVPTFIRMFAEMGGTLPGPTRILMAWSQSRISPPVILITMVLIIFLYRLFRRIKPIEFDKFKLVFPIWGGLVRQAELWKFCRTLGSLLKSQVPMVRALELTEQITRNKAMSLAVAKLKEEIEQGSSLSEGCKKLRVFPQTATWMISMGETRGNLDDTLLELANFYDFQVRFSGAKIRSAIGPVLIIAMGIFVFFVVLSMYLPIFSMTSAIGGGGGGE
jgi:type IV pilus assembly protein PilC